MFKIISMILLLQFTFFPFQSYLNASMSYEKFIEISERVRSERNIEEKTPPKNDQDWEDYFKYIIQAKKAISQSDFDEASKLLKKASILGVNEKYFEVEKELKNKKNLKVNIAEINKYIKVLNEYLPSSFPSDYDRYSSFECFNSDATATIRNNYDKAVVLVHGYHQEKVFTSSSKTKYFYKKYWRNYIKHFSYKKGNVLICTYNWNTHSGILANDADNVLLQKLLLELERIVNTSNINIIAHSQGGNYAKYSLLTLDAIHKDFFSSDKEADNLSNKIKEYIKTNSNIIDSDKLMLLARLLRNRVITNMIQSNKNSIYTSSSSGIKLITLATPHAGTSLSQLRNIGSILEMIEHTSKDQDKDFGDFLNNISKIANKYDNKGIRETLPISENKFLKKLNKLYKQSDFIKNTYTFSGNHDIVVDEYSAHYILGTSIPNSNKMSIPTDKTFKVNLGHNGFIEGSSELFRKIDNIIWQ